MAGNTSKLIETCFLVVGHIPLSQPVIMNNVDSTDGLETVQVRHKTRDLPIFRRFLSAVALPMVMNCLGNMLPWLLLGSSGEKVAALQQRFESLFWCIACEIFMVGPARVGPARVVPINETRLSPVMVVVQPFLKQAWTYLCC